MENLESSQNFIFEDFNIEKESLLKIFNLYEKNPIESLNYLEKMGGFFFRSIIFIFLLHKSIFYYSN